MSIATIRPLPARACGYARAVSPRVRARVLVGLAAAASAALVVGVTVLQAEDGGSSEARARFAELAAGNPESVEAAVGAAIAAWPDGTLERLEDLVAAHPDSGVARLHLGFALLAAGDAEAAEREWREAERRDPDSPAALRAEDILHPQFAPGRPPF